MGRRVRIAGARWTYSEIAARQFFDEELEITLCDGFWQVVQGLRDDDRAILPIENTVNGTFAQVADVFLERHPWIVGETIVRFDHALIGHPGATLDGIEHVVTRPEVRSHCRDFLDEHDLPWSPARTTADAVRRVRDEQGPEVAAIASPIAAKQLGMEVIRQGIQDRDDILNRFFAVARFRQEIPDDADTTSIAFVTPHRPGALNRCLSVLADRGIDLTRLDCRPIPDRPWHYAFHADLEGSAADSDVAEALQELGRRSLEVRLLGSYKSAPEP